MTASEQIDPSNRVRTPRAIRRALEGLGGGKARSLDFSADD
jgi:hypothetical protein